MQTENNKKHEFFQALQFGKVETVKQLIADGIDVNAVYDGETPLQLVAQCCSNDTLEIYQLLLDAGAEVNFADNEGNTAFTKAVFVDNWYVAGWLFNAGAEVNPNHCNSAGETILSQAAGSEFVSSAFVKFLLEKGGDVYHKDSQGNTALHQAVKRRVADGMKYPLLCLYNSFANEIARREGKIFEPVKSENIGEPHEIKACDNEAVKTVTMLIEAGADLFAEIDYWYMTPLHIAACCGLSEVCQLLIDNGVPVDDRSLFEACRDGHELRRIEKLKILLKNGGNVNAIDENGTTPLLYIAGEYENKGVSPETCRFLIENGADVNEPKLNPPLLHTANQGRYEICEILINAGANVNAGIGYCTPLARAAFYGYTDIIKLLLDNGADPNSYAAVSFTDIEKIGLRNTKRYNGSDIMIIDNEVEPSTPALHLAARNGHLDTCKLLLVAGADINRTTADEIPLTAAEAAVDKNKEDQHWDVFDYFIEQGGKTILFTPLCLAVLRGDLKQCKKLIDSGVDVNEKSKNGQLPLTYAIDNGWTAVCKLLLDNGADWEYQMNGNYFLHDAAMKGYPDICKFLITAGMDVNLSNLIGETPLYFAVKHANLTTCKLLVEEGADVNQFVLQEGSENDHFDFIHKTVLDIAEEKHFTELCRYLRSVGCKRGRD